MTILVFKALHLIFMVSWFAGLFYMVRLFIYFAEANEKTETEKNILFKQYKLMQWRLWYIISWPAMILTLFFGLSMLYINPAYASIPYMHLKLGMVFLLVIYHIQSHFIFLQQQREIIKYSSNFLRIWNEIATLFLVAIVFVIFLKNQLSWIYGVVGFLLFGVVLMLAIRLYKRIRSND